MTLGKSLARVFREGKFVDAVDTEPYVKYFMDYYKDSIEVLLEVLAHNFGAHLTDLASYAVEDLQSISIPVEDETTLAVARLTPCDVPDEMTDNVSGQQVVELAKSALLRLLSETHSDDTFIVLRNMLMIDLDSDDQLYVEFRGTAKNLYPNKNARVLIPRFRKVEDTLNVYTIHYNTDVMSTTMLQVDEEIDFLKFGPEKQTEF